MAQSFRVQPLGAAKHNEETFSILGQIEGRQQSVFIRRAIIEYAESLEGGYTHGEHSLSEKPEFLTDSQWGKFKHWSSESKTVDYSFLIAFYWIKNQFKYIRDGELQREIIVNSKGLIPDFSSEVQP